MKEAKETLRYSDLILVAFLVLREHPIIKAEKDPADNRTQFYFEKTDKILKDTQLYFEDTPVEIAVRSLGKRFKDLKFFCHQPNLSTLIMRPTDKKER